MIKRAPAQSHRTLAERERGRRKKNPFSSVAPIIWILAAAVAAFFFGAHLKKLAHHPVRIHKIDAASLFVLPSSVGSNILIVTPDGRKVILGSDLEPAAMAPLLQSLILEHVTSVNAVILTGVSSKTQAGLNDLVTRIKIIGPVVAPYGTAASNEWWGRTQANFTAAVKLDHLNLINWTNSVAALKIAAPEADVTIYAPLRSAWEVPVDAVKISYQSSSLLDVSSLNPKQVASLTGRADIGPSRILVIDGQDVDVTKEILAQVQPDLVLLSGTSGAPPGDDAELNIQAADAQAITLSGSPPLKITLPASDTQPLKSAPL